LNFDEIIANEKVLAKGTVKVNASSHFRIFKNLYRIPIWGSLYVTDRHISFKGKMKGRFSLGIISVFVTIVGIIIANYLTISSSGSNLGKSLFSGPFLLYYMMLLITSIITLWIPYKVQKKLKAGYVWPRENIEIEIYKTKISIIEREKISVFDCEIEDNELFRVLNTQSVEFQIADVSKLDYHEKIEVLDLRYKSGKISKELYEELKKKLPYT
jgi:hypothetical protein